MSISFPSVTSIMSWAKSTVMYLGGDDCLPYVQVGSLFYYFTRTDKNYILSMTSLQDIGDKNR